VRKLHNRWERGRKLRLSFRLRVSPRRQPFLHRNGQTPRILPLRFGKQNASKCPPKWHKRVREPGCHEETKTDVDFEPDLVARNPRPVSHNKIRKKTQIIAYSARVEKRFMTRKVTALCFRTRLLLLPTLSDCLRLCHPRTQPHSHYRQQNPISSFCSPGSTCNPWLSRPHAGPITRPSALAALRSTKHRLSSLFTDYAMLCAVFFLMI
jgi:hypothetical protein